MEPISLWTGIRFCKSAQRKGWKKVGTVSKEGTLIMPTLDKASKITKNDAKTIQDEDIQIKVPNAVTEKIERGCS